MRRVILSTMKNRLESYFQEIAEDREAQSAAIDAALIAGLDDLNEERPYVLDIDGEEVRVTLDEVCEWEAYEFDDMTASDYVEMDSVQDPLDQVLSEQRSASERIIRESQRLHGLPVLEEEDDGEGFLTH